MFRSGIMKMKMQCLASFITAILIFDYELNLIEASSSTLVKRFCESGLDFNTIKEFNQFISEFKTRSKDQLREDKVSDNCIRDHEAILELERIITTKNVCDYLKIEELIQYHNRYFNSRRFYGTPKQPMTQKFFTKYAIQVAYICKKNLFRNLEFAKEELQDRTNVFEEARDRVYKEDPSIKPNVKLIAEQSDIPPATNVKPQDQAESILSEYREALTKLRRPEDILTFDRNDCEKNKYRETPISKDKLQIFFKPAVICLQLSRYYSGSVLSIAKLANYGYMAIDEELDIKLSDDPTIKDWIIAVQVCDPLLFMSTNRTEGEWAYIDTCSTRVTSIEMMVFDDNFDELDDELLKVIVPKSEATRRHAQKLMKSALKKMAKKNIMQQLNSNASKRSIFSKSLSMLSSSLRKSSFLRSGKKFTTSLSMKSLSDVSGLNIFGQAKDEPSDKESLELLMNAASSGSRTNGDTNSIDGAVSIFDPLSSLMSTITVFAIMFSFEWLFFIIMALAARVCHSLHFNFDDILTFPPKVLSWSDSDFARLNEKMEQIDEDDLFDYDELNPEEREQRDLLAKVFGRAPPMLYRE